MEKEEQKQHLINMMRDDENLGLYKEEKQETTLEEKAEEYEYTDGIYGFKAGAKWQAERMYSEDEVRKLLQTQRGNCYVAILTKNKDKELAEIANNAPEPSGYNGWVKQFKKK
jgi:hypothetical protein